jgi:hypothetical protein
MRFEALWIGAPSAELDFYQKSFEADEDAKKGMQYDFDEYLARPGNIDLKGRAKPRWTKYSAVVDTTKTLAAGDPLIARVIRDGKLAETPITVSDAPVTNAFVEGPQ